MSRARRRVRRDEYRADLGGGELQDHSFRYVRGPDHHSLSVLDANRHQATRNHTRSVLERREGVARPTGRKQRVVIGQRFGEPVRSVPMVSSR